MRSILFSHCGRVAVDNSTFQNLLDEKICVPDIMSLIVKTKATLIRARGCSDAGMYRNNKVALYDKDPPCLGEAF